MGQKITGTISALALLFSIANPAHSDGTGPASLPDCSQPLQPSLKAANFCLAETALEKESRLSRRAIQEEYDQAVADAQAVYKDALKPLQRDHYWASGNSFSVIKMTGAALHDTMAAQLQQANEAYDAALKEQQAGETARRGAIEQDYRAPRN